MKSLHRVEREHIRKNVPEFKVGDTVKVFVKVIEGDKVRNQVFQGTVIGRRGGGIRETFTVRKVTANIAVERIFPLHSPNIVKIERVMEGKVNRAQLTYMKSRKGKSARIAGKRTETEAEAPAEAPAAGPAQAASPEEPAEEQAEAAAK
jgi:large subunit ribosomal protein L19